MADGSTNKLLDREELRHATRGEYEEVTLKPEQDFRFHTGLPLAGVLGYQDDCLEGIPETSNKSFDGTGNPFSAVEIKPGEKVANFGIQVI